MARAIVWPQVPQASQAPLPMPAEAFDPAAIAAAFGPELTRMMGVRISSRPDQTAFAASQPAIAIGRIRLAGKGPAAIDISLPGDGAAMLLERLFGGRAGDAAAARAADLALLPPGSASWLALCRIVMGAAARAFATAGQPPAGAPAIPARALACDATPGPSLLLDVDGAQCRLFLVPEIPATPQHKPPVPDLPRFRQQARERALDVDLPVSLRIGETRLPVAEVAALIEGDILPLERPENLDVMAGGRRIARFPSTIFNAPPGGEQGQ